VAEAEDGATAISLVADQHPDVVLMDIQMPVIDGLEATRRIIAEQKNEDVRVLILTTFERDDYIFQALHAGASGFLLKNSPPEELITAVRVVSKGEALLAPSVTRRIISEFVKRSGPTSVSCDIRNLSEREVEVLRLVARGKTNTEIAGELFIGEATVKTHVSNILSKLDLRDRVQLVVCAYESGLVRPGID
jgi:DNA-binding NarL/FixJ family response regulator